MINADELRLLVNNSRSEVTKKRKRILKKIEKEMIAAAKNGRDFIDYSFDVKDYCFFRDYLICLGYVVTNTTWWYAGYMERNVIISWHSSENKDYGKPPTGKMPIKPKEIKLEPCSKEAEIVVERCADMTRSNSKYWDKNARPKFIGN